MLRSLIAHVFFLFATAAIAIAGHQSARAEMPFETWLSVAADSLDQKIGQQMELSWKSLDAIGQRTAESFDRVLDQCRMGVAGRRGMQFVRAIEILVKLRDSGAARVVAPAKNWNFPEENCELQRCRVAQDTGESLHRQDSKAASSLIASKVVKNFSVLRRQVCVSHRLLRTTLSRLAIQTNHAADRIEEAVLGPAEPLVLATTQAWDQWIAAPAKQHPAELSELSLQNQEKSTLSEASGGWSASFLINYWLEVSNSAQAKLNWLTSKVRHIAEDCLESIKPQFLILELDSMA